MAKTGLSYYSSETDRFQDIRLKRLKKQYGCEGYAVFQYVQNEIFRVEGCYIRFTDDQAFDVAEYWGIDEERVLEIINYCTEIELFDRIIWKTKQVLTSESIQQKYAEICRRAKKRTLIPEDISLISEQEAHAVAASPLPLFDNTEEVTTKTGKAVYSTPKLEQTGNPAETRRVPQNFAENRHKEKEKKENPPSIPPMGTLEEEVSLRLKNIGKQALSATSNPANVPKRNTDGLMYRFQRLNISGREAEELLTISRGDEIGHPIWELLQQVDNSKGKITMPGRFLLAKLKAC